MNKDLQTSKMAANNYIDNGDGSSTIIITSRKYGHFYVKIDTDNVDKIKHLRWGISKNKRNFYAVHSYSRTYLHQLLTDCPKTLEVDHINRDTLDNRISNLRCVTSAENQYNKLARGYYFHIPSGKWMAYICVNKVQKNLGYYSSESEAAAVRAAAKSAMHIIVDKKSV